MEWLKIPYSVLKDEDVTEIYKRYTLYNEYHAAVERSPRSKNKGETGGKTPTRRPRRRGRRR